MTTRLLSLAAGTILDVDPAAAVNVAEQSGFAAVGLWFDAQTWSAQRTRELSAALAKSPVIALDIEPIMLSATGDHGDRIVDIAQQVGARNILVASRDHEIDRVAQRLVELADRLDRSSTIRIVLEFLPILGIKTLWQAHQAVLQANRPALGLLIDSLHLDRAGHSPADLAPLPSSLFPYLQLCDAPSTLSDLSPASRLHEALHGRLLLGDGGLPINELLTAIPLVPISLELRSERLLAAFPDPVERAEHLLRTTRKFLSP